MSFLSVPSPSLHPMPRTETWRKAPIRVRVVGVRPSVVQELTASQIHD